MPFLVVALGSGGVTNPAAPIHVGSGNPIVTGIAA